MCNQKECLVCDLLLERSGGTISGELIKYTGGAPELEVIGGYPINIQETRTKDEEWWEFD